MAIPSAVYRLCSSSIMKLMLAPNLQVSKEVEKCAHLQIYGRQKLDCFVRNVKRLSLGSRFPIHTFILR